MEKIDQTQSNIQIDKEIDIKKLISIVKKRFWVVVLLVIIFTALGGVYSYKFTEPLYQSSARYILQGATPEQVNTYNVIMKDPAILDKVITELNLSTSSESLGQQISLVTDSQVVTVIVTGSSPYITSKIANTLLSVFRIEIQNITGYSGMTVLSKAKMEDNMTPINQGHFKKILISLAIGLVSGVGLVFFLNSLDDSFKSEGEIEALLGIPVLGRVSKMRRISTKQQKKGSQSLAVRGESIGTK